jgi:tRNA modification GTPase
MIDVDDTIAAIASPAGRGGVGIIRLSGNNALSIAQKIVQKKVLPPRMAVYTQVIDEHAEPIDNGIVIYFKAPNSYTGEDVLEFQMHGSPYVLAEILRLCQLYGARLARAGEFTERAFLNDKMDLTQAEAVADLINAQSQTAARMANRTLQGQFSQKVKSIEDALKNLRMYVESTIDFSDEALEWLEKHHWEERLHQIIADIQQLKAKAKQGQIMQQGLKIVIAGRPNAGKSTLMNALVEKDVAIVTSTAGTTRDVMKEQVLLDDIPVILIDTAGLRETEDEIEREGIKRAWQVIAEADIVLFLHDASREDWQQDELAPTLKAQLPQGIPVIHVLNKVDTLKQTPQDVLAIAAKTGLGIDDLKQNIKSQLGLSTEQSEFMTRKRHFIIFAEVEKQLDAAITAFHSHQAPELLAEDLRYAHEHLMAITGEFSADDLLGEIFSNFCIGK